MESKDEAWVWQEDGLQLVGLEQVVGALVEVDDGYFASQLMHFRWHGVRKSPGLNTRQFVCCLLLELRIA